MSKFLCGECIHNGCGCLIPNNLGYVDNCQHYMHKHIPNVNQTNEEYLKSCDTEELAEVLNKIFMTRTFCHICPEGDVCDLGYECKYHGGEICDFMKWLKATHRG